MISTRPLPSSSGWLKLWFATLLFFISASAAVACPLCYELASELMKEGVQLDLAEQVVLAVPAAVPNQYRIVAVIKGKDQVGDIVAASVTGIDTPEAAGSDPYLLVRNDSTQQWSGLGTIRADYAQWLRQLAATLLVKGERPPTRPSNMRTTVTLSYPGWRQRTALVLPHLEDPDPLAARIAWEEVARAPYEVMDVVRSRIDPGTVAGWLDDPKLVARRASYTLLLGFVGGSADADRLEQRLEMAWSSHDDTNLAAMIGADLELRGPSRVDWVESKYFADRQRTMPEIEAALLALDVQGDANRNIPRDRVIQALRVFISDRPTMAGFVAPQLSEWNYWDEATEYEALLRSGVLKNDPASEFAVVTYLRDAAKSGVTVDLPNNTTRP
jgi:hypothetical protein